VDAGRQLADELAARDLVHPVVLGLARGGVPVALEIARRVGATLDVYVARKVGAPHHPEYGIGAVAEGGTVVHDRGALELLGLAKPDFDRLAEREADEVRRRVRRYRAGRPLPELRGRDVVVVDDGLATGVTAEAAVLDIERRSPRSVLLAVPVCARDTAARLATVADDVACLRSPADFGAVGRWYDRFEQTTDEEVLALLARAGPEATPETPMRVERPVVVPQAGGLEVHGDLVVPERAVGAVVFAHGSGSSRHSSRNRRVAAHLQVNGVATLLLDLLTEDEELADLRSGHLRFDIDLLAGRLAWAVRWITDQPETRTLPIGFFGASTGAAAALAAAAREPDRISAVVSRGGRPDLAGEHLGAVRAPTLLIVGGADTQVLELNRQAAARLAVDHRIEIVPGATHLFEEPGALERVADLAGRWFTTHLGAEVPVR
jgi:putative phosphoribosyl transferase